MNSLTISPIRAFSDNYIWLIAKGDLAYVVDPGDPEPVTVALEAAQLRLAGILVTHHHYDHTGAVEALKQQTECDVWALQTARRGHTNTPWSRATRSAYLA